MGLLRRRPGERKASTPKCPDCFIMEMPHRPTDWKGEGGPRGGGRRRNDASSSRPLPPPPLLRRHQRHFSSSHARKCELATQKSVIALKSPRSRSLLHFPPSYARFQVGAAFLLPCAAWPLKDPPNTTTALPLLLPPGNESAGGKGRRKPAERSRQRRRRPFHEKSFARRRQEWSLPTPRGTIVQTVIWRNFKDSKCVKHFKF